MFKRDIVICIRKAGTSDTPIALPVVDDTIDITTKDVSTKIDKVTLSNPRFTPLNVNRGKRETTLKFTTYIKPQQDTGIGLADLLLYESLLGDTAAITSTTITMDTVDTYDLSSFDVFLIYKNGGTTFSLKDAVTVRAEFMFDITGISRVKWSVSGIEYLPDDTPIYSYSDNTDDYILNNWTKATIEFPPLNKSYNLASTDFSFIINNAITFPYVETLPIKYTKASTTPVLRKRSIEVKYSLYLRVMPLYNDLIDVIEQYTYLDDYANFNAKIGPCDNEILDITVGNATLIYPKIKQSDAATLELNMSGETATILFNKEN